MDLSVKNMEKMVYEDSKNIQIREAQDGTNWDTEEKRQKAEKENEALYAELQEAKRQRPKVFNKVASSREICDVLEEYSERMSCSLRRDAADRTHAIAVSYEEAMYRLRQAEKEFTLAAQHKHLCLQALSDKLKLIVDSGAHMAAHASMAQRQGEAVIVCARSQACSCDDGTRALRSEVAAAVLRLEAAIRGRDKAITDLRSSAQRQVEAEGELTRDRAHASVTAAAITVEFNVHYADLQKRVVLLEAVLAERDKTITRLSSQSNQNAAKANADAAKARMTIANLQRELLASSAHAARTTNSASFLEIHSSHLIAKAGQLSASLQELKKVRRYASETSAALARSERALLDARTAANNERNSQQRKYSNALAVLRSQMQESAGREAALQNKLTGIAEQMMSVTRAAQVAADAALRTAVDKAKEVHSDATVTARARAHTIMAMDVKPAVQIKKVPKKSVEKQLQNVKAGKESVGIDGKKSSMSRKRTASGARADVAHDDDDDSLSKLPKSLHQNVASEVPQYECVSDTDEEEEPEYDATWSLRPLKDYTFA